MRNQWYADHRDLVKWGTLLHLAAVHDLRSMIQIAYLTADEAPILITSELGETPVDGRVLDHFRNIHRISDLCGQDGPRVSVFDRSFSAHSRTEYTRAAIAAIKVLAPRSAAVLLDPDTGLAEKPASSKHVTSSEVTAFWSMLEPSDWLVLYQHAAREPDWLQARHTSFAKACGDPPVLTFRAARGSRDVVFFAACRGASA